MAEKDDEGYQQVKSRKEKRIEATNSKTMQGMNMNNCQ